MDKQRGTLKLLSSIKWMGREISKNVTYKIAGTLAIAAFLYFAGVLHAADQPAPNTLPAGGQVTAGQGNITTSGSTMTISQQSQNMIMNWQSFSIGQNAAVNFVQPGSTATALNRVLGSDPSAIYGSLTANGRVFLINPSGIIFGPTARVDVGGLVASTLNMKDSDFLIGKYSFFKDGAAGSILNQGTLTAKAAGFIAMLAPEIRNEGIVTADLGTVAFGAGEKMTLNFSGNGLLGITVEEGSLNALIENKNLMQADGGTVLMTARAANELALSAVNSDGIVRARSIQERDGVIILDSGQSGMTTISGTLDASATDGTGGRVIATGDRVLVKSGAHLTASGAFGGGEVLVGGSWQNSDASVRQAIGTVVEQGALLEANATDRGNGGTVVAWSDVKNPLSVTRAYGTFEAKGGLNGGDGGRIETSGHWLDVAIAPDTSALGGRGGLWLVDPYNITVVAGGGTTNINAANPFVSTGDSSSLGVDLIDTALGSGDVTIQTGAGGTQAGDITWDTAYTYSGANARSLSLLAHRDILLNQSIASNNGALGLTFTADSDSNGTGGTVVRGDLTTNGGAITFNGLGTIFSGSAAQTVSTSDSNVTFHGEVLIANTNGLTINAGNGNVLFGSTVNSGNSYTYDSTARTWNAALTAVSSGAGDATGSTYLATVISALEMTAVMAAAGGSQAWLGGSDASVEGTWRWVTGPEGMENSGAGRVFWTTAQSTGATGYTGYSSRYVNWNTGEPNNVGVGGEDALQMGAGLTGQWNDLPNNSSTLGSIIETNLALSPLTITSGTVTFSGAVGGIKPLKSLSVTAATTAINGGAVTIGILGDGGVQSYSGNITLGSANTVLTNVDTPTSFTVASGKSITNASGGDATLTIKNTAPIILDTNSSISSSTGKLNTVLWSDTDANGGYIWMKSGSSIATNGGHLWMGGGNGSTTWNGLTVGNGYALGDNGMSNGILLDAVTISTSGGNMAYYGKGRAGAAVGGESGVNSNGIRLGYSGNSSISSGTGTILFDGVAQGTDQNSIGFESCSVGSANNHAITSAATSGDAITIKGSGSLGASTQDWGIYLHNGTSITATGGGNIVLEGTSGGSQQATYINTTATVNSNSGNLTVTGDTFYLAGTLSGTGALIVQPKTAGTTIGIAGGAGTLSLPASYFSTNFTNGFSNITAGNVNSGALTIGANATTFNDNTTLIGSSVTLGAVNLNLVENLTLQAAAGDILTTTNQATVITKNSGNDATLTFKASGSIALGSTSTETHSITSSSNKLNVVVQADSDNNGSGAVLLDQLAATTNGGNLTVGGGADPAADDAVATGAAMNGWTMDHGIAVYGSTLNVGAGALSMRGSSAVNNGDGIRFRGWSGEDNSLAATGGITLVGSATGGTPGYGINLANQGGSHTYTGGNISITANSFTFASPENGGAPAARFQAPSGAVTLTATSATTITETANTVINADTLNLQGAGATYSLNLGTHTVTTLQGNTGSIAYLDDNALTLGAIASTGTLDIATLIGDLTLTGAVSTTNATADAINLNAGKSTAAGTATGGNIIVAGGSVNVGAGGRATLYSGSVSGSTGLTALIGSGSGNFRYNSDETAANYTTALGAGNYAIYREQPTVTVTANDASKAYDGLAYAGGNGVSYAGFVNGDTSAMLGGALSYGGTSQGAVDPGSYTITPSGCTNGRGYALAYTNGTLTINKLALTVTALNLSRAYNGVPFSGGNGVSYSGFAAGDDSSLLGGTLSYSSTSQGSVSTGTYVIRPYGLTSSKYDFIYVDGVLTIAAAPYVPPTPAQSPASANPAPTTVVQSPLPSGMAVSFVPITPVGGPSIMTSTEQLYAVGFNQQASQQLVAQGGSGPYTWRLVSGELPVGVSVDPLSGALTGTPTTKGIFPFEVEVIDSRGARTAKKFLLYVNSNEL